MQILIKLTLARNKMIKPVQISSIGRKVIATTMFATAVLASNANTLKNSNKNIEEKQKTELISSDASKAMASNAIIPQTFSFEHNKKLDKIFLENCDLDSSKKDKKENLDAIYRIYGTYGATIEIQRLIDSQLIENTINTFLGHYTLPRQIVERGQEVTSHFYGWQDLVFFTDLFKEELNMYQKQEYPSAETATEMIDNHINNSEFFNEGDKKIYNDHSKIFKAKQTNPNSAQAKSDLLAYKVHLLNILAFNNYFAQEHMLPEKSLFMFYFSNYFVSGENVIKP